MKLRNIITANFSSIFEEGLLNEISNNGILKSAEPEKIILEIRRKVNFIPIIISGTAKVVRRDGKGNGIFLHYLSNKQTSATAITYALENKNSEIRIEALTDITYVSIPSEVLNLWFVKYKSWRTFYFKQSELETTHLIQSISDISFIGLEQRLLKYLEYRATVSNTNTIHSKHFDIARDLKVSRESVSRVLKKLEKENLISLGRNKVSLN